MLFSCNQEGKEGRKEGNSAAPEDLASPSHHHPSSSRRQRHLGVTSVRTPALSFITVHVTLGARPRAEPNLVASIQVKAGRQFHTADGLPRARRGLVSQLPDDRGKEGKVCMSLSLGTSSDRFVPVSCPPAGACAPRCSRCGLGSRVCWRHAHRARTRGGRVHAAWRSPPPSWGAGFLDCISTFSFK